MPTGAKLWRLKYRHGGKESVCSIGNYKEISLAGAGAERDRARDRLRQGKDPVAERRAVKAAVGSEQENTFAAVAKEWLAKQTYSARHCAAQQKRLDDDLIPVIGALPVGTVTPAQVLDVLRRFESRGTLEMGAKCRRMASQIFRYAVQTGQATSVPAALFAGAIKTRRQASRNGATQGNAGAAQDDRGGAFRDQHQARVLLAAADRSVHRRNASRVMGRDRRRRAVAYLGRADEDEPRARRAALQAGSASVAARRGVAHRRRRFCRALPRIHSARRAFGKRICSPSSPAPVISRGRRRTVSALRSRPGHEVREADPDAIEACLAHGKEGVCGVYNRASYLSRRRVLPEACADQLEAWGMRLPSGTNSRDTQVKEARAWTRSVKMPPHLAGHPRLIPELMRVLKLKPPHSRCAAPCLQNLFHPASSSPGDTGSSFLLVSISISHKLRRSLTISAMTEPQSPGCG